MSQEAKGQAINVEEYLPKIEMMLMRNGLNLSNVDIVDDFPGDANPLRAARCFKIAKKIEIRRHISPESKENYLNELYKFQEQLGMLQDDWTFIKHIVLRYACQINNRWKDDYECAKWAFFDAKNY
ncbi:MAG: hypothetical protein HYS21_10340 [Deltaproteobacteria bacterium]|nr:hypothetical protein [Deltaproteobacteria bacterium]